MTYTINSSKQLDLSRFVVQGTGCGMGTVTVNGKVFDQQAVNYWLGGTLAYEILQYDPPDALIYDVWAGLWIYHQNDVNDEKWAWYQAGKALSPSLPSPPADLQDMLPGAPSTSIITWNWGWLHGDVSP